MQKKKIVLLFVIVIVLATMCGTLLANLINRKISKSKVNIYYKNVDTPPIDSSDSNDIKDKLSMYQFKDMELYNGTIEHVFFHPLIAYPELAFDGDSMSKGLDDFFTTVPEYNRILEALYRKNFILVNPNYFYEKIKDGSGNSITKRKPAMFPKGKKPLIISVDDINYYSYMMKNGCVNKLVLDKNENIATLTTLSSGEIKIAYDNETVPILNTFINKHPDFSFNGARGILALTGFDGILGYRVNYDSKNIESEKIEAQKVVNRLKETGWMFASHTYGHIHFTKVSNIRVVDDTTKWDKYVKSIVGPTNLMIYPYGEAAPFYSEKLDILKRNGFELFYTVSSYSSEIEKNGIITAGRRHMDGIAFRTQRKLFLDLLDVNKIIDIPGRNGTK